MESGVIRIIFQCNENGEYEILRVRPNEDCTLDESELMELNILEDFDFGEYSVPSDPGFYCMDVAPNDEMAPDVFYVLILWLAAAY